MKNLLSKKKKKIVKNLLILSFIYFLKNYSTSIKIFKKSFLKVKELVAGQLVEARSKPVRRTGAADVYNNLFV